jgi:phosphoglucomutase
MPTSPLADKPAPTEMLVDLARLDRDDYERKPDGGDSTHLVAFGTSGHRGSSLRGSFTEAHILAITQAICDYRRSQSSDGPLYMGKDTHADIFGVQDETSQKIAIVLKVILAAEDEAARAASRSTKRKAIGSAAVEKVARRELEKTASMNHRLAVRGLPVT